MFYVTINTCSVMSLVVTVLGGKATCVLCITQRHYIAFMKVNTLSTIKDNVLIRVS